MKKQLEEKLIALAEARQVKGDPSHDFQHIRRVLFMAEKIAAHEKADLDVVIPAALFHDTVVYRKDSEARKNETDESAIVAGEILETVDGFPKTKIVRVKACIRECSFTKGLEPSSRESAVLQDADLLESTGAISIVRTFSSGGQMNRQFYFPADPFRKTTEPNAFESGLDLFYARLLKASARLNTAFAKQIAKRRDKFLKRFLAELETDLAEAGVVSKA